MQLNQEQFEQNRSQEISHIQLQELVVSEGSQANPLFNVGKEASSSYLQLPTRNRPHYMHEEEQLSIRCGEIGHTKHLCTASVWCKFCVTLTHSMKACRRYANFVRDNLIAFSRRMTPVQNEMSRRSEAVPQQQSNGPNQRQLFPQQSQQMLQPPVQHFQPPLVPPVETHRVQQPAAHCGTWFYKEVFRKRNSQDVHRDPQF